MRNLFILAAAVLSFQLSAQTGFEHVREISKKITKDIAANRFDPANLADPKTHKLDSIITHDANGIILLKLEMEYNAEGQTTVTRQYEKDSISTNLLLTSVITSEYDNGPYPTHITFEAFNPETQQLEKELEYEIFYGPSNRIDSLVLSLIDPFSGEFGELLGIKNTYNGDLLDFSGQWINFSGIWLPFSETDYVYNQGLLVEVLTSFLNFDTFQMELSSRTTYTYDVNDRIETSTFYYWEDPNWAPENQTLYEYFPNGTLKNEIAQVFLFGDWVNESWTEYHQDVIDDQFDATYYFWINDGWQRIDSAHHNLNPSLPWANVAAPTELSVLSDVNLFFTSFLDLSVLSIVESQFFTYNSLSGDFEFSNRDTFYYSLFDPSRVETVLPEYLHVSPNPASTDIIIDMKAEVNGTYTVTSLSGQRIAQGRLDNGKTVVRSDNWLPGFYMILFEFEDGAKYVHKQVIK